MMDIKEAFLPWFIYFLFKKILHLRINLLKVMVLKLKLKLNKIKLKDITITDSFQKILDDSKRKANKIWVDKRSEFYKKSLKSWLRKMI